MADEKAVAVVVSRSPRPEATGRIIRVMVDGFDVADIRGVSEDLAPSLLAVLLRGGATVMTAEDPTKPVTAEDVV